MAKNITSRAFTAFKLATILLCTLTNCSEKPVVVPPEGRQTMTFLSEARVDKEEIKKSFVFKPSEKMIIATTPHTLPVKVASMNIACDQNILYALSPKTIERFNIREKKFQKPIPFNKADKTMLISVAQNHLVSVNKKGKIIVVDLKAEKIIFEKDLEVAVSTKALIDKNVFYIQTTSNEVFCFDLNSGKEIWTYKNQPGLAGFAEGSSPIVYKNFFITGFTTGDFSVIDKTNGLLQWNDSLYGQVGFINTDIMHVTSKPIVEDNIIYAIGVADNFSAYKIDSGEVVWSKKIGSHLDLLSNGNYIYVLDNKGILITFNKKNGQVRMVSDVGATLNMPKNYSNMIVANHQLFFATILTKWKSQGVFVNPNNGKVEKVLPLQGVMRDINVCGNQIFVLTDKKLYVITN